MTGHAAPSRSLQARLAVTRRSRGTSRGSQRSSSGHRIAVRFAYEWHDESGQWYRSYGNENWEFDGHGFMRRRLASINDLPIQETDRKFRWPAGRRPDDHPGLAELGL